MDPKKEVVLNSFTTPKTLYQVAEELQVGYHTLYRYVRELEKSGLIKRLPAFQRKAVYVVTTGATKPGRNYLTIYTGPDKEINIRDLIISTQTTEKGAVGAWKRLGGLLAHLSIRAWRKSQGIEIHPEPITAKLMLNDIRDMLKRAIAIVDQIQFAPIWDDGEMDLLEAMGIEDPQEFLELAVWWEHLWQGRPQEEPADKDTPDDEPPVDSDTPKLRPV